MPREEMTLGKDQVPNVSIQQEVISIKTVIARTKNQNQPNKQTFSIWETRKKKQIRQTSLEWVLTRKRRKTKLLSEITQGSEVQDESNRVEWGACRKQRMHNHCMLPSAKVQSMSIQTRLTSRASVSSCQSRMAPKRLLCIIKTQRNCPGILSPCRFVIATLSNPLTAIALNLMMRR